MSVFAEENKVNILDFVLSFVYLVVFISVLAVYIKSFRTSLLDNNGVVYFIAFLLLGILVRGCAFALAALNAFGWLKLPASVLFMLETSPSFFFFTVYLLLLYLWGEVYQSARNRGSGSLLRFQHEPNPTLRLALIAINAVMYMVAVALYILDMKYAGISTSSFLPLHDKVTGTFSSTVYVFSAFMYVAVTLTFFVYGYFIYKKRLYMDGARRTQEQRLMLKRVGILAVCCMLIFTARAVLTLLQIVSPLGLLENKLWWVDGLYYPLLEVVPVSLMLAVIVEIAAPAATVVVLNGGDTTTTTSYKTPLIRPSTPSFKA
eukprot:TRINITY_DN22683_c0_g1_i1.p1 TRINITY_DN22683_c0_g1~~TRINITY_DN22683_c0_g1_i1.p1  ORF type:complete len:318 (-),score=102.03 TRINITY_DN22683_c0_g1_i1:512-1465(-)